MIDVTTVAGLAATANRLKAGASWLGRAAALLALAGAAVLSGCSGTGPVLPGATTGLTTTASAGQQGQAQQLQAMSPEEVAASGGGVPTNPFGDLTSTPTGGREVIANPTLEEVLAPASPLLDERSYGRSDAPVVIVEYASLTCPFCKAFHAEVFPRLKRDYIDTGKVRFILREFPIGRQSGQATVALRCAPPEKYLDLYGRFLAQQSRWVSQEVRIDPIAAVAAESGLSRAAYDACRADPKLTEGLKLVKDRGRKLGIIGTPNFFVGNKLIKKALDWPALQAEIEPLLAGSPPRAANTAARPPG